MLNENDQYRGAKTINEMLDIGLHPVVVLTRAECEGKHTEIYAYRVLANLDNKAVGKVNVQLQFDKSCNLKTDESFREYLAGLFEYPEFISKLHTNKRFLRMIMLARFIENPDNLLELWIIKQQVQLYINDHNLFEKWNEEFCTVASEVMDTLKKS